MNGGSTRIRTDDTERLNHFTVLGPEVMLDSSDELDSIQEAECVLRPEDRTRYFVDQFGYE
jgi:hypothetical protein